MTKPFLADPSRVELNGVDVSHLINFSIDTLKKRSEVFQSLDYDHDVEVEFGEYAEGTLEFRPMDRAYGNDPSTVVDVLGFALGHAEYDTATDFITLVTTDDLDSDTPEAASQRIVEVRQVDSTASHAISDSGAADEAWAQQFIAGGEDIYLVRFKLYNASGDIVTSFELELWSDDGSDKPDAKLASTNTVLVTCGAGSDDATNDYIGALTVGSSYNDATWETIDMSANTPNLLGTATMTIGTKYWLVLRNVLAADKNLYVNYTTTEYNDNGVALQDDDVDNSPAWGDAPANTKDLAFILQFYTTEGLQLDFYDYATTTTGLQYTFKKVMCTNESGLSVSPQQVAQGVLKWTSEDVTISTI
jgi:hypothetical protein